MPEVVPIDVAVSEPKRAMVGVIWLLTLNVLFHGEVSSEPNPSGAYEWVKVRKMMVGSVFRYQNVTVKKLQGGVGFFLTKAGERGLSEESGDYEKSRFHTQRSSLSRTKNKEGKSRESLRDRFF